MNSRGTLIKVTVFTIAMLLVSAGLVVVFGEFRFASNHTYHADFSNASRLKGGEDVRIAGIPVGTVKRVELTPDNNVSVTFDLDKRYQLYDSTRAVIRYENLVGDRYLEIASGAGEMRKLPPGSTIARDHTQPALDLDALLGGMRPVLKGLDGKKINEISSALIELLQGQGGALSQMLASTSSFTTTLASRDQLIGDVINNLNTVLTTVDDKSEQFDATVDRLQQLITGLAQGKDAIAGAIGPLSSVENDLADTLRRTRRPLQGVIENARPLATVLDKRKQELNDVIDPLEENYLRLNALGAYGSFFNINYCTVALKFNGPAGSDITLPMGGQNDTSKGGALLSKIDGVNPVRTGLLGIALVACLVLVSFGYTSLPFWPQGKTYHGYFADAGGIIPGNDVTVSGIRVGKVKSVALAGASAKVDFTVDRKVRVGDQSLAAIRTDTVLGEKALSITPAGAGSVAVIPLERTRAPYTLNNALQDLGGDARDLDKPRFEEALQVLTDSMRDATPQLRGALDGVSALSRSINRRDEALGQLLTHAKVVTGVLNQRADQVNRLVLDGNQLFAAVDERRQALGALISGIDDVSQQLSGFVADNEKEIGPTLNKLNLVLDNMIERKDRIAGALERLPGYATTLGEVVASGPGFQINLYGLPPPTMSEVMVDMFFQPGKLPDSLADYLRGMISERTIIKPKSP